MRDSHLRFSNSYPLDESLLDDLGISVESAAGVISLECSFYANSKKLTLSKSAAAQRMDTKPLAQSYGPAND